jgi:hypothetical protein
MKREFLNKITITESMAEDAARAEQDHEVQMARADCFYAAKDAIELHKILTGISEQQGLPGWVASKITLASDYLKSVKEYLEYKEMGQQVAAPQMDPAIEFVEASTINGRVQSDDELVWKQTSMGYEQAVEKYGKEHVKQGGKNRRGDDTVEIHVPLVAEDGGTSSGSVATSMGGGNGFVDGGPGTVKRFKKRVSEGLPSVGANYNTGSQGAGGAGAGANTGSDDGGDEIAAALKKAGNANLANKIKTGTTFNKDELAAIIAAKG